MDNKLDEMSKLRHSYGIRNGRAKLSDEKVLEMRRRFEAGGITKKQLAAEYGVSGPMACYAINGKNWTRVG